MKKNIFKFLSVILIATNIVMLIIVINFGISNKKLKNEVNELKNNSSVITELQPEIITVEPDPASLLPDASSN